MNTINNTTSLLFLLLLLAIFVHSQTNQPLHNPPPIQQQAIHIISIPQPSTIDTLAQPPQQNQQTIAQEKEKQGSESVICPESPQTQKLINNAYSQGLKWGIMIGIIFSLLFLIVLQKRKQVPEPVSQVESNLSNPQKDKIIRCMIVGDAEVGKSCILQRIYNQSFSEQYIPTIGAHFKMKELQNEKLMIWDTAGQEKYKISSFSYIKGLKIFYIVYDCQNRHSFMKIPQIIEQLRETHEEFDHAYICIVGNKMDGEKREVKDEEGEELSKKYGVAFCEVSAKANKNIDELYKQASAWLQEHSQSPQLKSKVV